MLPKVNQLQNRLLLHGNVVFYIVTSHHSCINCHHVKAMLWSSSPMEIMALLRGRSNFCFSCGCSV